MKVTARAESANIVENVEAAGFSSHTISPLENATVTRTIVSEQVLHPTVQSTEWNEASYTGSRERSSGEPVDADAINYGAMGEFVDFSRTDSGLTVSQFRRGEKLSVILERNGKTATIDLDDEWKIIVHSDGIAAVNEDIAGDYTMTQDGDVQFTSLCVAPIGKKIADVTITDSGAKVRLLAA